MYYFQIPARLSVKFPYKPEVPVEDAGVLTGCMERLVSRKRMDEIICQMVKRHPYIEGAVYINVPIVWTDEEGNSGLYHEMRFLNDNVTSQLPGNPAIQFEL